MTTTNEASTGKYYVLTINAKFPAGKTIDQQIDKQLKEFFKPLEVDESAFNFTTNERIMSFVVSPKEREKYEKIAKFLVEKKHILKYFLVEEEL